MFAFHPHQDVFVAGPADLMALDGVPSREATLFPLVETAFQIDLDTVTVEVVAGWAHEFLAAALADTDVEWMRVRVWETDVAFGGYTGPVG